MTDTEPSDPKSNTAAILLAGVAGAFFVILILFAVTNENSDSDTSGSDGTTSAGETGPDTEVSPPDGETGPDTEG